MLRVLLSSFFTRHGCTGFRGPSHVRIFTCNGPSITIQTQPASPVRRGMLDLQLMVDGWCGRDFTSARNFTFKAPRLGYRWARSPSLQHDVLTVAERIRLREDHDESFPRVFRSSDRTFSTKLKSHLQHFLSFVSSRWQDCQHE